MDTLQRETILFWKYLHYSTKKRICSRWERIVFFKGRPYFRRVLNNREPSFNFQKSCSFAKNKKKNIQDLHTCIHAFSRGTTRLLILQRDLERIRLARLRGTSKYFDELFINDVDDLFFQVILAEQKKKTKTRG